MDKDKTVDWINRFLEAGVIKFPAKMTPGLYELQTEIENFGGKKGRDGRIKYEALVGHDDLISCLKLAVHFAKAKFLKLGNIMRFDGVALDIYDQVEYTPGRQEQAQTFAKSFLDKKGTNYDTVDIKFSS